MNALLAALINGGIASGLMAVMIWVLLRLIPRRALNAATRYAIWWVAMLVTIALPSLFLNTHGTEPVRLEPAFKITPFAQPSVMVLPAQTPRTTSLPSIPIAKPVPIVPSLHVPTFPIQFLPARWPLWIFAAWVLAAVGLMLRLVVSFILLYRLRSHGSDVSSDLGQQVQQWGDCGWPRRSIRLRASRDIATPVAIGPWRPSILIPASMLENLDADELTQIGLHEAAHFARRDDYALLVQRVIEALLALHPVVRWIARRIDLEREIACDDRVIAATGNPASYAACLVRVVELSEGVRPSLAAAAAAEDSSHLARRVDMLLDKSRHTGVLMLKTRLSMMVAVVIVAALAAGKISGLVAFAQPLPADPTPIHLPQATKVTLLPQQTADKKESSPDVAGVVLDDASGNPLPSAELRFHKTGIHELAADLETDRQGRFSAPGLADGEYTVEALKPNFVTTSFKLQVPSGSPLIRLVRYGVIDGQAMDAQGKPLPGRILDRGRTTGSTRITVLVKSPGSEELQTFRDVSLEDAGRYRIFDLPPGEYVIGIWYSGLSDGSGMQFYPDNSNPRIFTVLGGEEYSNINFVVSARPAWRVSGNVVLPEGVKGQFQLGLGMPDQPMLPVSQTLTESDGSFHFEKVPAGTYDLFVAGPTGGYTAFESILGRGKSFFARSRINVAAQNLEGLSLPVAEGRTVKVMLKAVGSEGIPQGCPAKAAVTLTALEPWGTQLIGRGQAEYGKEQTLSSLAPGRFRVDAVDLGSGCFQVKRPVVDLGTEVTEPVVVEVASAGSIKGVLPGGGNFAVVLLDAAATNGAQARLAFPDGEGKFGFEGLPPARYRISAQPANAASRARWVSSHGGQEVTVAGGAATSVQLSAPAVEGGRR